MSDVPADDRGFTLGDGLFETILADRGRLVLWDEHLARLARGCEALGLPAPGPRDCERAAGAALAQAGLSTERAAVRITWSAGSGGRGLDRPPAPLPRLVVAAAPASKPSGAAVLATAAVRRNPGSPTSRLKTLAYLDNVLAREEARRAGADEALMLNTAGEVACAAAANLFWVEGREILTPALSAGVLDGVIRGALIARARAAGLAVREVVAPRSALASVEAAWLTNSLIGVRPVARLDGNDIPDADGWSRRAAALVSDLI